MSAMKKLYVKKGKVHPSPPTVADRLSLLPATILTLTVALSPEDKEVLAYLISCSGTANNFSGNRKSSLRGGDSTCGDHPPQFNCDCFRCYMSYWVRWDTSPNRQLIHEVLDAYEDGLFQQGKKNVKARKERRRKRVGDSAEENKRDSGESESVEVSRDGDVEVDGEDGEVGLGTESVRKLLSFIGERIWGFWGI